MPAIESEQSADQAPGVRKLLIDLGPLAVFFIANAKFGIFTATGAFMVASLAALAAGWILERRIAPMPLVTAIVVLIFGGLTLYFENETFIKLKPTIVSTLFASVLLGGLVFKKYFIQTILGGSMRLTPQGWRLLTLLWGLFFIVLAIVNEIAWRNLSTDAWVKFKTFALPGLSILFAIVQTPVARRHELEDEPQG